MNESAICPLFRNASGGALAPLLAGDRACRHICSACRCCDPGARAHDWLAMVAGALAADEKPAEKPAPWTRP